MKKQVAKIFFIYSLPDIAAKIIPFIIIPIATAYLTLEDFGYIALFNLAFVIFIMFKEFGPAYIINSTWFKISDNEKKELLFNIFIISTLLTLIAIVIVNLTYKTIFPLILGEDWQVINKIYWAIIIKVIADIPTGIFLSWTIIEQKAKLNTKVQFLYIFISAFTYILLVIETQNYVYIILGEVFVMLLIGIIKTIIIIPKMKLIFRKKFLILIYKIGSPIYLRSIFNQIRNKIDRFFIADIFGSGQYAVYNFSTKFNPMYEMAHRNYQKSYQPILFKQLSENKIEIDYIRRILLFWAFLSFTFVFGLTIFGQQFIDVFSNNMFSEAYPVVLLFSCVLLVGQIFAGNGVVIIHFRETKYLLYITIIQSILNIILCIVFIPFLGAIGAVIALWTGNLLYQILMFIRKRKIITIPFIENQIVYYVVIFHIIIILKVFLKFDYIADILISVAYLILIVDLYIKNRIYIKNAINNVLKKIKSN